MTKKLLFIVLLTTFSASSFAASQCVPVSSWVKTKEQERVGADEVIKEAVDNKVILLGEDHDNMEHHRWQLSMITQAYAHQPKMAIGFEMLPRGVQPILDDWVAGELTEKEFLKQVKWHEVWNYNPDYYLPMFHFARMNRIPMYALNIPREFISTIGEKGWEGLSEKTREMIGKPAPATPAYREMMEEVFAQHQAHGSHGGAKEDKTDEQKEKDASRQDNFIQGQLAWDRAMAGVIKRALNREEVELLVGVMGAGHIMPAMAVPYQLEKLDVKDVISLMPWDDTMPCDEFSDQMAQYVFGVDKTIKAAEKKKVTPHKRPILGVFLEKAEDGVLISKVVEDSIAAASGIQKDDILIEAAGVPMRDVPDVVKVVRAMAPGTWLPMKVKRINQTIQFVAKFPAK